MTDISENKQRMQRGELYHAFTPELSAERTRCQNAVNRFNDARETTRRHRIQLWRDITQDTRPLPPPLEDAGEDEAQFTTPTPTDPWIEPPLRADYGYNIHVHPTAFVNYNNTFIDTCRITIDARTLVGPNCSFYSGSHPLDPAVRRGTEGPEHGAEVVVGQDCWLGGNVVILPGVTVGRGSTVGAGSVVTKDVEPFTVVVGNPARMVRRVESEMDTRSKLEMPRVDVGELEQQGQPKVWEKPQAVVQANGLDVAREDEQGIEKASDEGKAPSLDDYLKGFMSRR